MNFDKYSQKNDFYGKSSAVELVEKYGSPLYVYNENILKQRCREMMNLIRYPHFKVHYSVKANSNLELLKIIRKEGLFVDAMSPGEMFVELKAGFTPEQILFICNNVSAEEMKYAIERNINVSVDSLSQLDLYGSLNPGGNVFVRINPGIGVGHSENVITGGKKTKFGIKMVINDGDFHPVDSSQLAFELATKACIRENYRKAVPAILEPMMKVSIDVPAEFRGAVLTSINQRRGTVLETRDEEHLAIVTGEIPLSEIFGYGTALRSNTQGKAELSIEFDRYEKVPKNLEEDILAEIQKANDEKKK